MIIENSKLTHMVKNYIMLGSREYNMQLVRYNLKYDKEIQNFKFSYTLKINDKEINCSQIIFKNDVLNIINYFIDDDYHIADNYKIEEDELGELKLQVSLKDIKQKKKVKGD